MRRTVLVALLLLAPAVLVTLLSANEALVEAACPAPSVARGGQCVLLGDATLSDTMWLTSGTKLNCQGHRLTPAIAGILDDPRTVTNEFQPSHPEVAVFVHRSYGVKIQNCVLSNFDFGIIVANSKTADAPRSARQTKNKILDNTIDVRTNAIDVLKSDGVIISGNRLTYASERGRGIVLEFDSDDNEITGNTIISTDAASTGQVRQLPGGLFVSQTAIMDNEIHTLQGDKPLQNLVVSGVLTQIATLDPPGSDIEDSGRPDHNVIEANDIIDLGVGTSCTLDPDTSCRSNTECAGKGVCLLKQNSGVAFNIRAADTVVRANHLSGRMDRGVSFGGVPAVTTFPNWFPGVCARNSSRLCSSNADCNIAGYDTTNSGACVGVAPATLNGNTMRLTAEDNVISGLYDTSALFANNSDHFVFRGNTVDGGASGIRINAATNGLIERNVVSNSANALYLAVQPAFSHAIRLNDFTGYAVAIRTSNDFKTATDVSADTGNYWGLACPGFDPARVLFDNGTMNPYVTDGKAYGLPVARTPDGMLPTRCQ